MSASHNPYGDNGLKLFGPGGSKLPHSWEYDIEGRMVTIPLEGPRGRSIGQITRYPEGPERYRRFVMKAVGRRRFKGLSVVVDCAHGAACQFTPAVLTALGAQVTTINAAPTGTNINRNCGSLHLGVIKAAVKAHGADLGISHDGDADRALFVDERGGIVDGDHILAMCARHLWRRKGGQPPAGIVVSTVMANLGLEHALREQGVRLVRTDVGDRWVKEAMDREGAVLGGEQSGHIIFSEYAPTGDGLLTALKVLQVLVSTKKKLSEVAALVTKYPQRLINVEVADKPPFPSLPTVQRVVSHQEQLLGEDGRILLRYSGTEPLARVMVEGTDAKRIRSAAMAIAEAIEQSIGSKTGRMS